MIIDEQALPEGGPLFSGYQNQDIIISPRQFDPIASDNVAEAKQQYDRLSELLHSNRLFVAPFCDACLIYRRLKHANNLGAKILEHKNLFWYTDGLLQEEVHKCVDQSYAIPGNFVAEFIIHACILDHLFPSVGRKSFPRLKSRPTEGNK